VSDIDEDAADIDEDMYSDFIQYMRSDGSLKVPQIDDDTMGEEAPIAPSEFYSDKPADDYTYDDLLKSPQNSNATDDLQYQEALEIETQSKANSDEWRKSMKKGEVFVMDADVVEDEEELTMFQRQERAEEREESEIIDEIDDFIQNIDKDDSIPDEDEDEDADQLDLAFPEMDDDPAPSVH